MNYPKENISTSLGMSGVESSSRDSAQKKSCSGDFAWKMRRMYVVVVFLLMITIAQAQNITKYEYFIDTDPGVGLGTQVNITPNTVVTDLNISVSTVSVAPGFHTVYFRSQNDVSQWSMTFSRAFFIENASASSSSIKKFEYFIDTDPGVGSATPFSITPAAVVTDQPIPVSTTSVPLGIHTVYVRAQSDLDQWSQTSTRTFVVDFTGPPVPTITSFSPSSGLAGVTIKENGIVIKRS